MELSTIVGFLTFGGSVLATGLLTGLVVFFIVKILREKYHMFI